MVQALTCLEKPIVLFHFEFYLGKSIQESTKKNFLKAVFHKFFLGPFLNTLSHLWLSGKSLF